MVFDLMSDETIEYANKFEWGENNIVTLTGGRKSGREALALEHKGRSYSIKRLAACLNADSWILVMKATVQLFQDMDEAFTDYLGIAKCNSEEEAIAEINRLFAKEKDGAHKYYVILKDYTTPIGLFYVYGYHEKYKRCSLALGLSKRYRGEGLAVEIIKRVCDDLIMQGINRISLEVETTNVSSLKCCEKLCAELGFQKEGILRNLYGKGVDCVVFSVISENRLTSVNAF